jgi:hypothetical protein
LLHLISQLGEGVIVVLSQSLAASSGVSTLAQLYGFASSAAQFAVSHIDTLKAADNPLANRCGLILEAVVQGFGVGSETALVLIGIGQSLLGNPLTGGTVAVATTNPVVLTCAAIGAVHYGWNALSEGERNGVLSSVGTAFGVGIEFARALADLAISTIRALMSAANYAELRRYVTEAAAAFGLRFSDITGALGDRLRDVTRPLWAGATAAGAAVASRLPVRRSG